MKSIFEIEDIDVNDLVAKTNEVLGQNHEEFLREISLSLNSIQSSDMMAVEKYHQILLLLNYKLQNFQYSENKQKPLVQDLIALLLISTKNWSELKVDFNHKPLQVNIDQSLQRFSSTLKFDSALYDSLEHFIFCQKWKVSGNLQDYTLWHKVATQLKANLDQNHYLRIFADILLAFGLNIKSDIINSSDFKYDQEGATFHGEGEPPKATVDIKTEIEIWKPENIVKLFLNYMEYYARQSDHKINDIEDKAKAIRHYIVVPLLKEFAHTQQEILLQLTIYDDRVNLFKYAATKNFTDEFKTELDAIAKQPQMLHSILKKPKLDTNGKIPTTTFAEQHPVLISSLKGVGYGMSALTIMLGAGTLVYVTGGAGALFIAGLLKTLGVAGSVAVSAAATAIPGGIIGAGVGVGKKQTSDAKQSVLKHVHFAADAKQEDGPKYDLTYNLYYRKFMKHYDVNKENFAAILTADNINENDNVPSAVQDAPTTDPVVTEDTNKNEIVKPFEFPGEIKLKM